MKRISAALALLLSFTFGLAQRSTTQADPYKVLATTKVGGMGGFDYVTADSLGRRLYVARSGPAGHLAVFNLDTLVGNGDIPNVSGHGATVNMKYGHGFITSKPVVMFDSKTLAVIKTLDVKGNPDGYLDDPFNDHVYILSHTEPNVTVIDAKDGAILGTIDLGGAPEQAASDGRGRLYIDIEDKNSIAVVDATTMSMTGKFDISNHGGGCAGLALDVKNEVLFASCRDKNNMIVLSAKDGRVLADLPIGKGSDGTIFNSTTNEAFSFQGDGTLTVIKENSPTSFAVEQTVKTPLHSKTLTLDTKTGKIFLITAEFGEMTPPVEGQRYGHAPIIPDSFSIVTVGK